MTALKKIAAAGLSNESWGPAFRDSGLEYFPIKHVDEVLKSNPDCIVIDGRTSEWVKELPKLVSKTSVPVLSLVGDHVAKDDLLRLKSNGSQGYVSESTPAEELALRVRTILNDSQKKDSKEARSANRVWFQQKVNFSVFDRQYTAWSTTLSQTGIFLRTPLSFPLYTVIQVDFQLLGEARHFKCNGVIVRQEVEGDIRGIGVMFQNLTGENVRLLESFLEIYK